MIEPPGGIKDSAVLQIQKRAKTFTSYVSSNCFFVMLAIFSTACCLLATSARMSSPPSSLTRESDCGGPADTGVAPSDQSFPIWEEAPICEQSLANVRNMAQIEHVRALNFAVGVAADRLWIGVCFRILEC